MPALRVTALACLAAALCLPAGAAGASRELQGPTSAHAWTARVLAPVTARAAPRLAARRIVDLQPLAPLAPRPLRGPTVLLVTGARRVDGRQWVRLRLPVRPNGVQGWVPADLVRLNETRLRILIDQSDRRLVLFSSGRPVLRAPVAIGAEGTPTPNGHFAVAEMHRTRTPGAFLGPVVFPLTGYSETLNEYAGGQGRVAIHGTSLPQLLGTRASHGCIRVGNRWIVRLSRVVRPGTPVDIRP
jgi:lipoprotein-anchoring transpeptidase ErfK/SrfK